MRFELSRESVLEELSRNMAEDKDKITLLSMALDSKDKERMRKRMRSSNGSQKNLIF